MDKVALQDLLAGIKDNSVSASQAMDKLRSLPFEKLDFACLDTHRYLRQGLPEVVFGEGKTTKQVIGIIERLKSHNQLVVATRIRPQMAKEIIDAVPEAVWHEEANILTVGQFPQLKSGYKVAVLSAGTADLAIASEARIMLSACGIDNELVVDVGVSGIQRLLAKMDSIGQADVIVVIAGMDGALPSVIGGLVACPVVAVPTSIGYGASFDGLAALLSMLNSCSAGLTVVNIDNGFGAAVAAARLINQIEKQVDRRK